MEKRSILTLSGVRPPTLSILSYNIGAAVLSSESEILRMKHIAKILIQHKPDVVCLLDVSIMDFHLLKRLLSVRYILFQVFIEEKNKSGEVLLLSRETTQIVDGTQPYYYDYNQGKGRVLGVDLHFGPFDQGIHVLFCKLDDKLENADIRAAQFEIVKQVLAPLENALLVGDFNIHSIDEPVEAHIESIKLNDAWIKMGCPSDVRITRNTRIFYTENAPFVPNSLTMVGTALLKKINSLPARHYGLMATFQKASKI